MTYKNKNIIIILTNDYKRHSMDNIKDNLFSLADDKYRLFTSKLVPGIDIERIIGIRSPALRNFADKLYRENNYEGFLQQLPHFYFEENNLHMILICRIRDFNKCIDSVDRFLPYIDNWATCDLPLPKCFIKHKEELLKYVYKWIKSDSVYTVRYGVGCLMRLFLDEDFKPEYLKKVAIIKSDEYYINMMIAWYFATALAKQWTSAIVYLQNGALSKFAHNKTIQKAIESYRITGEQKAYLRKLKVR